MAYVSPPFTITNEMLDLTARIARKVGALSGYRSFEARPYLKRNNRIRSVYSSLAIEANTLSLDEVRGVIDGRTVIGPENEIREVRNAYRAYDMLGRFDPRSVEDLKKLHGVMTCGTVDEAGRFRSREEGVFRDGQCIFLAPPPHLVPELIGSLFDWMAASRERIHPLILSSVFHYEFVFIHPFADGNGRIARLWQTALLVEWDPVFRYMPLESRILAHQDGYYDAIAACNAAGNSDAFITFMLGMIDQALDGALSQMSEEDALRSREVRALLDTMEYGVPYTGSQLMARLGLRSRDNFRKLYLVPALEQGLIAMTIPDKPTSRNQTYVRL